MYFSRTTEKDGAIQMIESLCRLGDGGITNDTTLFKQITGYYNQSAKKVASALMRVDKNWKIDDSNYTNFGIATIDLEDGIRDYPLPASTVGGNYATLYKVNAFYILDTSGNYQRIDLMDTDEEEDTTSGVPTKYRLIGGSIRLKTTPATGSVTLTAGLKIEFQRAWDEFTTADTTQQLPFNDAWHQAVCYDTASTYLLPIDRQLAIDYRNIFAEMVKEAQKDHAKKNDDAQDIITSETIYSI